VAVSSKVIVITGASGGIGAALARQLGAAGHALVLGARRGAELRHAAREASPSAIPVITDVTNREAVQRLRDRALDAFGHVDVWVNNAGRGITRSVLELTDADVDAMIAVNVKAVLYGMQAIVPHFVDRGAGHLITVSSFLGRVPLAPHRSAYSAAKAAINTLTTSLRLDLLASAPAINVSLVMPGLVATDFSRNALGGEGAGAPDVVPPRNAPSDARSAGAGGSPAVPPRGGMKPQTADEVAGLIADLVERPVAELYTSEASRALVLTYYEDVAKFENRMRSGPRAAETARAS
jgi:NADP-dependent 3-hydroxy acid dehydrogenase YdfG